jgi:hypothetical protein
MTSKSLNCLETAKGLAKQVADTESEQRLVMLMTIPAINKVFQPALLCRNDSLIFYFSKASPKTK